MPLQETLDLLEKSLDGSIETLRKLKRENAALRKELDRLKLQLEDLKAKSEQSSQLIGEYESDREEVRSRVTDILQRIAAMESEGGASLQT